ncbi:DUF732 domain-containing protein [Mycobacteroides salmoniphilum]|uniref:DUF732 domain-containing protein n=1 Tax=Mycobacteroides salmoniphilum TaxID=404941 RepID=A0A4R8SDZ6_9MYCO|nr:DUF732 domain-containing protein [Mycobacteroides salmoniphilum]TDZ93682.1 hypothetical protein CCUG60885_03286 [Mycobacteroides salmoniphilum]TEA09465.1 hypothetical protein CCUG60883_00227 [Mycobacteroides salmoniphilum]
MVTNFRRFSAAGILAASVAGAVSLAGPAHADGEGEFLQMLNDTTPGTAIFGGASARYLASGYRACDALRAGSSREDAIAAATVFPGLQARWEVSSIVDIAPKTLCPDVKH